MAEPPLDIDRIVREVIAELDPGPQASAVAQKSEVAGAKRNVDPKACGSGTSQAQPPAAPMAATPMSDTLVLSCRVVTLSEMSGRLEKIRRLVAPPGAIVTPAVRDELRRRNVSLAFAPPPSDSVCRVRLVLVTAGRRFDPTALIRQLGREPIDVEAHPSDCLIAATNLLAGRVVQPGTLGLLLAREMAAGVCLANRHHGVRAASATDPATVSAAIASIGANLLVIDPTAAAFHQLRQTIVEFCRGGARQCPEVFRKQLA